MLLLFDIDGTLLVTKGAGQRAMQDAGRELFHEGFTIEGVDFAGRLDPLILRDLLVNNGVEASVANIRAMREAYERHLPARLDHEGLTLALPGVLELLAVLRREASVTLGLLTGNFERTGSMKLVRAGVDPEWFAVRVWGDMSPHEPPAREHLPPVGLELHARRRGRAASAALATVIGDTPHDVRCAAAHGCRSLGVATGRFSVQELHEAGATIAVDNLTDTESIARWLSSPPMLEVQGR